MKNEKHPKPTLTVESFFKRHAEALQLELIGDEVGFERLILEPTINRPGLAISGFFDYFAEKRIQALGSAEMAYLRSLPEEQVAERMHEIYAQNIPCMVISRGAEPPEAVISEAAHAKIAVFRTPMVTMNFINSATLLVEDDFAPTASEHGSMVDIMGIGVMIRGASGVGKSECVLGLIERGYSLVADDITRFKKLDQRELMGRSPALTRYHMEVRGIGIINVASVFGIGSIRNEKRLDLVVTLKDWQDIEEVNRIGLDQDLYEILDIKIPHVTLPVRVGRDLARLIEVAALDQKLRSMGENSAQQFNERLLKKMQQPNKES